MRQNRIYIGHVGLWYKLPHVNYSQCCAIETNLRIILKQGQDHDLGTRGQTCDQRRTCKYFDLTDQSNGETDAKLASQTRDISIDEDKIAKSDDVLRDRKCRDETYDSIALPQAVESYAHIGERCD